jgi:hypothetical protein
MEIQVPCHVWRDGGKPRKPPSQDSRSSGRKLNLGHPEFEEVGLFDLDVQWFYDRRSYKRATDFSMGCTSEKSFNYRSGRQDRPWDRHSLLPNSCRGVLPS